MSIIKRIFKYILGKQYFRFALLWQLRNSKKKPPILIYQMGKVGSKAIEDILESMHLPNAILHVHVLSHDGIECGELYRRSKARGDNEYWKNIYLREIIESRKDVVKWKVITLVREPIARNISAYFENRDLWRSQLNEATVNENNDVDILINDYFSMFDHDRPLKWFDTEIKSIFNIDVFSESFPTEAGYKIYRQDNVELLLIRLESLRDVFDSSLYEFLGVKGAALLESNTGNSKPYSQLYRRFKNNIQFPEAYIKRMYASRYARAFYSEEELKKFRLQWRGENES